MAENVIYSGNPLSGFVADSTYGYLTMIQNPGFSLVTGETYTVVWDDAENPFTVTAYDATIPGVGTFVAIGNGTALGYQGNGEPFVIAVNSDYAYFLAGTDSASSHIVAISQAEAEAEDKGADIVLRDRNGNKITYPGIEKIVLGTADGETVEFVASAFGFSDEHLKWLTYQVDSENKQILLHAILYDVLYEITGSYDVTIPDKIGGYDVVIVCK